MIEVLRIPVDGPVRLLTVDDGLDSMQALVGGDIEMIQGPGWSAFIDEEGKFKPLPLNRLATRVAGEVGWPGAGYDVLLGPVVFLGVPDEEGNDTSVTEIITDLFPLL